MHQVPSAYARPPWWWIVGRPAEIWVRYLDVVAEFVRSQKLAPIDRKHLIADDPIPIFQMAEQGGAELRALRPRPFPGGLRFAHLHLGEDVYRLGPEQWQDFSRRVVEDFRKRLDQAKTVNFDQLMQLSEGMAGLG